MGQHRCGGGCIDDLENDPANGCRFGCGDPCPTPPDGASSCDMAGLCTFECPVPFHREGTECVCTPRTCDELGFTCGAPDDGCGSPLDCGSCGGDGVCVEGTCACGADEHEPNDSSLAAAVIGSMTDAPDSHATFETFNIDAADDEDWFRISVDDRFDFGNPQVTVTLDDIPAGSDYDLSAWYTCNGGGDEGCTVGSPCTGRASGSIQEMVSFGTSCGGSDDDGTLWIRVTSSRWGGSCSPYTLDVDVH